MLLIHYKYHSSKLKVDEQDTYLVSSLEAKSLTSH